jgi:hypothetical protein
MYRLEAESKYRRAELLREAANERLAKQGRAGQPDCAQTFLHRALAFAKRIGTQNPRVKQVRNTPQVALSNKQA